MSDPVRDGSGEAEFREYVPRQYRGQVSSEVERPPYVRSASTVPFSAEQERPRRTRSDLWPDAIPELQEPQEDRFLAVLGRVVLVSAFAAVIALLLVFGRPILDPVLETVRPLLNADSQSKQLSKTAERIAAPDAGATRALAALPAATSTSPQVRLAPPTQQQSSLTPSATPLG
jgi:hypothetical protein